MKKHRTILVIGVNKKLERMIKMKKEELKRCTDVAEEIFKTIIGKGDILELANDYGEENPYNSSCCAVDIEYEENGELLYPRYTLAQISENHKYLHCSGCNSKLSIVDFSSNFLDQSIPGAIKFLNNYLQAGLCLKDLEVPQKKQVILTEIRRLNNEYLAKCPDILETIKDESTVLCDGDPFDEEVLNKKRRNKKMNKTKYTNCTKIGRKIFNNIIDNVDIKGVINDCIGKYPDRLACCFIRVGGDDYLTRYRPMKIDTKRNTFQCSLCRKEWTIIDWCSRLMDLSIADTVKFIDKSSDGLDLFDIDSLDNSDKYEVIFAIREMNESYIEEEGSNIRIN